MKRILENISNLGMTLPECPQPVAAYIPACRCGSLIFVSGQLPSTEGKMPQGRVPNEVSAEDAYTAAGQCFMNGLAAALSVLEANESLRLVQMQGFVQCVPEFKEIPQVINGASELAMKVFGTEGTHARTAVGVAALPKNAPVEIAFTYQVEKEDSPKFEGRYNWL